VRGTLAAAHPRFLFVLFLSLPSPDGATGRRPGAGSDGLPFFLAGWLLRGQMRWLGHCVVRGRGGAASAEAVQRPYGGGAGLWRRRESRASSRMQQKSKATTSIRMGRNSRPGGAGRVDGWTDRRWPWRGRGWCGSPSATGGGAVHGRRAPRPRSRPIWARSRWVGPAIPVVSVVTEHGTHPLAIRGWGARSGPGA
jgi:hypothetical protein